MKQNEIESIRQLLIQELLSNVGSTSKTQTQSLLEMTGKGTSETVHSAIIGFLLDPVAHENGMECLKEFIKLFPDETFGKFNPERVVEVKIEKDLGEVTCTPFNKYPTGGRADIYLEDADGNVIVIENKIYAGDSDCQLLRYHNSLNDSKKSHVLVYLTLKGKRPSDLSLGLENPNIKNPLPAESVKLLSYSSIQQWLDKISEFCSPQMKDNIEQYTRLLDNLLMDKQVIDKILSSGNSYRAAIDVARHLEDARMYLKEEFISLLKNELTQSIWVWEHYTIGEYNNPRNSKLVGLTLNSKSSDLRFDVVIDWRLYITCNRNYPEILKEDNGRWDYVGGKDAYNFHDCSELIEEYLSSDEGKHPIPSLASREIVDIICSIEENKINYIN